jgi:hypothetical protein
VERLVKGITGATERHLTAGASIRSPWGGRGLRVVGRGCVRAGAREGDGRGVGVRSKYLEGGE